MIPAPAGPPGDILRIWRRRRHLSQLDLALEAEISQRHLSCLESGRARPSRAMLLRLAERLGIPLRERNALLVAAGYAPVFAARSLDDPALAPARRAVARILDGHAPYPALAVDRHWTLIAANAAVAPLLDGVDPALLAGPVNVLRLSLHPGGLAPRILNLREWRAHLLDRLRQQVAASGDPVLARLADELAAYPAPPDVPSHAASCDGGGVAVPLVLAVPAGRLSLLSTTTVFGTPVDITLAELALEAFFPADPETAALPPPARPAARPGADRPLDGDRFMSVPAYAVAHLRDVALGPAIATYLAGIDATLAPFGGRFLIHGARPEPLEGDFAGDLVVIAFPDRAAARAWYESPAYRAILPLRTAHSDGVVVLIDGVSPTTAPPTPSPAGRPRGRGLRPTEHGANTPLALSGRRSVAQPG